MFMSCALRLILRLRKRPCVFLCILLLFFSGGKAGHVVQGRQDVRPLVPGARIERELAGGETHAYQVTLASGQYAHAVVEQQGIDVVVKVFGPDGKQIAEVDSPNGIQGAEPISWVAAVAGAYRLEVSSFDKGAKAGRYETKLVELRMAVQDDRERMALEQVYQEGKTLLAQGTKESIEAGIGKYEEAQRLSQNLGDYPRAVLLLNTLGERLLSLGLPQRALSGLSLALSISRSHGDRTGESTAINNIAVAYALLGESQKALEHFQQALPLARAVGDRTLEATTLTNIGYINERLGEYQQAAESYRQALSAYRAAGDRSGEATALNNLGTLHYSLGEVQKALDYGQQALALRREIGERLGMAISLHNIGAIYGTMGDYERALRDFHQALPIFRALVDREGETRTLISIGDIYNAQGEYQRALDTFHQALPLIQSAGDRDGEASIRYSLGMAYLRLGDWRKSLEHYEQSVSLARAVGNRIIEAMALNYLGFAYETGGEKQRALDHYIHAMTLARAIRSPEQETVALYFQARLQRDLGALAEARGLVESSLDLTESLRTKVINQQLRSSFLAARQNRYELYLDLLMELDRKQPGAGHAVAALQASERARARSMLELMAESGTDLRRDVEPGLLAKESALQRQIRSKAEAQTRILSRQHSESEAAAVAKEIADLTSQLGDVETEIRRASPRYAALTQPQPLDLETIQKQVLDDETILLEYSFGEKRSYLWTVTPSSINSYELPAPQEIEAAAKRVYKQLIARLPQSGITESQQRARNADAEKKYWAEATTLSRMLLAPAALQLANKRLLIVAPGALQYIPFASLPEPNQEGPADPKTKKPATGRGSTLSPLRPVPLIAHHEIVNLPSASVLAVLRREFAGRQHASQSVAVLADPVFSEEDGRVKAAVASEQKAKAGVSEDLDTAAMKRAIRSVTGDERAGLQRLLFSRDEADAIVSLAPPSSVLKALDFKASRTTALSDQLSQYRIIHFATHGVLDSAHPELSGLALSLVDENGKEQDGYLRLNEIYNLKLNAELVVLSACQTGLGKEVRGEGLIGLTRGFMYAGAPRVVASLWQVNDAATAELMKRFYRGMLKNGLPPAAALRTAQLELMNRPAWQSPYFWGAFVLQGEWK